MMRKYFLFSLLFSFGVACQQGPHPYQAQIDHVDEMLLVNDSLIQAVFAIDSAQIESEYLVVDSVYKILTGEGAPVDDKRYWTVTISNLNLVYSPYKKYLRDIPKLKKDLLYSNNQLKSLRNSLLDQKIDTTQSSEYLKVEEQALYNSMLLASKRLNATERALAIWDTAADRYLQMLSERDSLLK